MDSDFIEAMRELAASFRDVAEAIREHAEVVRAESGEPDPDATMDE
jgi:hypothetical protein